MNINNNHHKTNVDLAYQSFIQIQMTNTGFLRREPTRGITTYHGENPYPSPLNLHPTLLQKYIFGVP